MNLRLHTILSLVLTLLAVSAYATSVNLRTAANFGLLAGSGVMNTGSSVIDGDVGSHGSTSAVTGSPPGLVHGTLHLAANAVTLQAKNDLTTAYDEAAGATLTEDLTGFDLGGMTLVPGVYFFSSLAQLTGDLILDGTGDPNGQWIFQIGSSLTTATGSSVAFKNGAGAKKCNVFWQVGSSATIGTGSDFVGNILALTSIWLNGGTLNGRALARNGEVTISSAEISNLPVPEPSSIMALGMMLIPAAVLLRRRK